MADWALFKRSCMTLTLTQKLMALIYDVHEGQNNCSNIFYTRYLFKRELVWFNRDTGKSAGADGVDIYWINDIIWLYVYMNFGVSKFYLGSISLSWILKQQWLLQCSVSNGPPEIILICWFYKYIWKQMYCLILEETLMHNFFQDESKFHNNSNVLLLFL